MKKLGSGEATRRVVSTTSGASLVVTVTQYGLEVKPLGSKGDGKTVSFLWSSLYRQAFEAKRMSLTNNRGRGQIRRHNKRRKGMKAQELMSSAQRAMLATFQSEDYKP